MDSRVATGLVFFTSALILVLEIVAGRLMAPYVGVSLEAFTGIIGTVLAGIALGSAVGGMLADRQDPRRLIGLALLFGGGLTFLSVPIVVTLGPGMSASPVNIVVLTACAFFLPTSVLSSISPMVAKLRLDSLEETGAVVGRLSAAGTVGALVGTFGTGFVLLGLFPIRAIIFVIAGLLTLTGVLVLLRVAKERPDGFQSSLVAIAAFLCLGVSNQCDVETDYSCARVVPDEDRAGGRSLILDRVRHAHVDLDDPTHLEIRYAQLLGAVIDGMPAGALDTLHVGGGGFSIPRYVSATRPDSTNVVLEIDEGLVDIARDELGLADAQNLDIRIGDARLEFEPLPTDGFDVIVGDAFGGDVVPWHLTTSEAVAEYDRLLRTDGVYVMNLIDGDESRFARAQMATLAEHFDHVAVMLPEGDLPSVPYNQIIVASDAPLPSVAIPEGAGSLVEGADATRYIGDAQILTDGFAPAEQLKQ
jgi:spermidine synthase